MYTITLCVYVCLYVRKTPKSGSLVVLSTRQYRLLNMHTHTHTGLLCIYVQLNPSYRLRMVERVNTVKVLG